MMNFAYVLLLLYALACFSTFPSFTSHSPGPFPFQMGALISQGPSMMLCRSQCAALLLKHKLISCSNPQEDKSRLLPPASCHDSVSSHHHPHTSLCRLCPLRVMHPPLLTCTWTVNVHALLINTFEPACSGKTRSYAARVRGIITPRATGICREIGGIFFFFHSILRYSSHLQDCSYETSLDCEA